MSNIHPKMSNTHQRMSTYAAQYVLTTGLLLSSLQGVMCQDLSFERGIQNHGSGNWTAAGSLRLTNKDMVVFEPLVTVQMVTEVCSINLKTCGASGQAPLNSGANDGQAPPTSNACYCRQESDVDYALYVSNQGQHPVKDFTLQATVPSRFLFNPLSLSAMIGDVPSAGQEATSPDACSTRVKELEENADSANKQIETLMKVISELVEDNKELENKLTSQTKNIVDTNKKVDAIYASVVPPCSDVETSDPRPIVTLGGGMKVVCDVKTDGGGWVVFQRRASAEVNFFRNWTEYQTGFGNLSSNFWLGLHNIHRLTLNNKFELRVDLIHKGKKYHAHYDSFRILGERQNYKLVVAGYSGTAGDSLLKWHNGMPFSTMDNDNDAYSDNCAKLYMGGWWYNRCHYSNLNGLWNSTAYGNGLNWRLLTGLYTSVSFTEMKMRPLRF